MYARVESKHKIGYSAKSRRWKAVVCVPQMTLYSSVFASPSRVNGANESGLGCTSDAYQLAAGKYADIATLEAACELGMEYTALTVAGAAERNKLAEVQYLRSQGCPWPTKLLERAALRGHFELVRWCREHGCLGKPI
jgi:hypothetical protein